MALRQCEKCSEMVDEAKAFCPGCGHAFVSEERRQNTSEFEKVDHTVQFGKTMYNQMLEDMGLKLGAVSTPEKRVEVISPVKIDPPAPASSEKSSESRRAPGRVKWYILIAVAIVALLPIAVASAIYIVLNVLERFR